jgi:hypothetical protein
VLERNHHVFLLLGERLGTFAQPLRGLSFHLHGSRKGEFGNENRAHYSVHNALGFRFQTLPMLMERCIKILTPLASVLRNSTRLAPGPLPVAPNDLSGQMLSSLYEEIFSGHVHPHLTGA